MENQRGNKLMRTLDTAFGPILLRGLALRKLFVGDSIPVEPRCIGVLCIGAIGDLLLCSSLLPGLQARFPNCRIVLFASETNKVLLPLIDADVIKVALSIGSPSKSLTAIRGEQCDIIIDCAQWPCIAAVLAALGGASWTIGFRVKGHSRHFCYNTAVEHRSDCHEIENYRSLTAVLKADFAFMPRLKILKEDQAECAALSLPQSYVALHPWPAGMRSDLKCWPNDRWVAVAEFLAAKNIDVVLTGGPADREKSAALAANAGAKAKVHDVAGRLSLGGTVELLRGARAVVSVNTGIMHLAAAVNPALIALSGPTNPKRWGPISKTAVSLAPSCEQCGYLNLGFEYPSDPPDCMGMISVSTVISALEQLLFTQQDVDHS